jgi:hypothetical protein
MIDLSPMLRLRLKSIDVEMAEMDRRREQLLRHKETIEAALIQEQALAASRSAAGMPEASPDDPDHGVDEEAPAERANLSKLLMAALSSGSKNLAELKVILDPHFPGGANGRAINFALVGLKKGGHVQRNKVTGYWRISESK